MALKILGRSPRVVSRDPEPMKAKGVTMRCDACESNIYLTFPYQATALQRQQEMKRGVDEHRLVCTGGGVEEKRIYELWYPRT